MYEEHWSWVPVAHAAPPGGATGPETIDAFIDGALEHAGLEAAPLADRRTLLRRLSFDLTGLPPTPAEVDAFERDTAAGAYERQVDRLLASPHFGERWARHWLDLFRYAETYGHEFDYAIPGAWAYRDAVVRAFDADVGFDRMILEHIAGDLVPDPRIDPATGHNDSLLATGSWWLGQETHAPTDARANELERIDNQIDVVTKAFMATTVSCARCHDHKLDPIPRADDYGFAGYLQSSRRQVAFIDPHGAIAEGVGCMLGLEREIARALEHGSAAPLAAFTGDAPAFLGAVREALQGTPREGESTLAPRVELFEVFDGDDWGAWATEGDAFGDAPSRADDSQLGGGGTARGTGFANSHVRHRDESSVDADPRTGRLLSPRFRIAHDELHVRIGGGDHPGKVGLRFEHESGEPLELTGHNSLKLREELLDLRALRGKWARIVIFDDVTGGWGNIRVDALHFADEGEFGALPLARSVEVVAAERGLDAAELTAWLQVARATDPSDPLDPLRPLLGDPTEEGLPNADEHGAAGPSLDGWSATGAAFGIGRVREGHEANARAVNQPIAGLLRDLRSRGLLDSTLVVWCAEFGRTPFAQGKNGRDHNPFGFSMWLAGGGTRGGTVIGATDEYGYKAVERPLEIHDLHATMLHLLGVDHTRLTVPFVGREMRLTDVHGHVVEEALS